MEHTIIRDGKFHQYVEVHKDGEVRKYIDGKCVADSRVAKVLLTPSPVWATPFLPATLTQK